MCYYFSSICTIQFQFYDSPIKSTSGDIFCICKQQFQFYDSPIKRETTTLANKNFVCFNSMIVRLKVHRSGQRRWCGLEFQFYDSPIKRDREKIKWSFRILFQFYDSPIKRRILLHSRPRSYRFQFYDSPIKRRCKVLFPNHL